MPLGLLIPILTPFVTELVKWLVNHTIANVPKTLVPVLSTAIGAAAVAIGPYAGVDLNVSLVQGAELGLAGTGLHQFQKLLRTKAVN